jgi:hypothetical protein
VVINYCTTDTLSKTENGIQPEKFCHQVNSKSKTRRLGIIYSFMILNILNKIQAVKAKFYKVANCFINDSPAFSEGFCLRGDSNEY